MLVGRTALPPPQPAKPSAITAAAAPCKAQRQPGDMARGWR